MKHALMFVLRSGIYCTLVIICCSFILESFAIDAVKEAADKSTTEEFDAVHKLHNHLDNDKNGDVDIKESNMFIQSQLHVQDDKRHLKFHSEDNMIDVNDLWKSWLKNEVSEWTPEQVVDWLRTIVHLPQYTEVFVTNKISGHHLPRLASDDTFLLRKLKISNLIDRKKIALRAMDVVLFGAPTKGDAEAKIKLEYDAVRRIHGHLDDDKNGDVDFKESKEFLQQELHVQDNKRHSKFHSGDSSITVDDLWKAWLKNEVSHWTANQVADWLKTVVHLPQYAELFIENNISGHLLPRLASDDGHLLNDLKISNVIDRKKIALRAMDVVLFGAPKGHNYLKDLVLGLAVIIAMAGFWFSNVQKRKAQKQIGLMMKDIECLQDAEKNLTDLHDRLNQAETSRQMIQQEKYQLESNLKTEIAAAKREAHRLREAREDQSEEIHTRLKLAEEELVQVREALRKAEKEVEYLSSSDLALSLEKWLQITYEKELKNFVRRRAAALRKMELAKDACDRINRKRTSIFGSLRLAHDQNIDEVDQKILAARSSLAEVTNDLEELQHRWQQIEICCRLDLGINSSLISDTVDAPPSPLGQALAMAGKVGSLGSAKSDITDSKMQRVSTYPSLKPYFEGGTPTKSTSYSNIARQQSAPPNINEHSENRNDTVVHSDTTQNILTSEHADEVSPGATSNGYKNNSGEEHFMEVGHSFSASFSVPPNESDYRSSSGSLKLKNNGVNERVVETRGKKKSSLSSDKFFSHKKKWWSRTKRPHSLVADHEFNEIGVGEVQTGSLPVLTHVNNAN